MEWCYSIRFLSKPHQHLLMKKLIFCALTALILISCSGNNSKETGSTETVISTESHEYTQEDSAAVNQEYDENLPTLLDFSATWCGPCKMIAPLVHDLNMEYKGKVNFIYVDIDEDPEKAGRFEIQAVPTFVLIDVDGNIVNRIEGADSESLKSALKDLANK